MISIKVLIIIGKAQLIPKCTWCFVNLAFTFFLVLVYVEWAKKWSRVNFVTIFGDLYKIKLWGICNNFNQFAHLSLASGPSNDVIKMSAIAQL